MIKVHRPCGEPVLLDGDAIGEKNGLLIIYQRARVVAVFAVGEWVYADMAVAPAPAPTNTVPSWDHDDYLRPGPYPEQED